MMVDIKFKPVRYIHDDFLKKASKGRGFKQAYDAPAMEYGVASEMLAARTRAGLTQDVVPTRCGRVSVQTLTVKNPQYRSLDVRDCQGTLWAF